MYNWRKHDMFIVGADTAHNPEHYDMLYNIRQTGFIAQEVEQAAKILGFDFSGIDSPKNDKDVYGLRYAAFTVPLVKAMQEQQKMIEELKIQNKKLGKENADYESRLKKLEGMIEYMYVIGQK